MADIACTCLPLNRALMAHLLKVTPGSVHEQGCVENAVAAALAATPAPALDVERLARAVIDHYHTCTSTDLRIRRDHLAVYCFHDCPAAIARTYEEADRG